MNTDSTSKPLIIENADNLLLLFVPYLLMISSLYYYEYWGQFNIDAFSYLETQDLIKGDIFQMRQFINTALFMIVMQPIIFILTRSWS